MSAKVEIYYWTTCPFCVRALKLLDRKGVDYIRHDITGDDAARTKMIARTGGPKSVPQIFINDKHIGGCDDLHELDYDGKLKDMLA
jgi:glutaredoxin 3|tara:strand:- start:258811 stop:259068 length:258 start_codon:yes stop_codon:yes gene_type:complete